MTDIEFQEAREQDLSAIVEFARAEYGERFNVHQEFYRHRYLRNPLVPGGLFVAWERGSVVGTLGWTAMPFWDGARRLTAGLVGDALTRQDVRQILLREGDHVYSVFTKLHAVAEDEARRRGLAYLYAFPNAQSHRSFARRFGYEELGALHFYVRPRRASALLRRRGIRTGPAGPLIDALARVVLALRWSRGTGRALTVRALEPDAPAFDRLWADLARSGLALNVRDTAAISWRFSGRPYRLVGAFAGEDLVGYACSVDEQLEGLRVRTVCDAIALRPADLARVLAAVDNDDGPDALLFVGRPLELGTGLRRAGFLDAGPAVLGKRFPVMRKMLGDTAAPAASWYLTLADNDVV